jgi:hypothetical protein
MYFLKKGYFMTSIDDIDELAHSAQRLGYRNTEQVVNRLTRMIVRNKAYLQRRQSRGTHTSHDDTTAEDMAVIGLVIQVLEGKVKL